MERVTWKLTISSVQFSRSVVSDSLRPHESQHTRPPCPSPTPGVHSDSRPSSQWCHPAISSSVVPFSSCPDPSQHQGLFQWVNSSHEVAKVVEFQLQHHSIQRNPRADLLQNGLVGSPCSPRDSQESSPTPQCKSINSSALSPLHSPTLTSIHDHRKNHSLDQIDLCWQSNVSALLRCNLCNNVDSFQIILFYNLKLFYQPNHFQFLLHIHSSHIYSFLTFI